MIDTIDHLAAASEALQPSTEETSAAEETTAMEQEELHTRALNIRAATL